jgi:kelch-like protein 19
VIRWVLHDIERRSGRLFQLLNAVRCHFLPPSFIANQLRTSDLIRCAPQCCEFLTRVASELAEHHRCKERPRQPAGSSLAVYIVGGYLRHSLNLVDCWSPDSRKWYSLPSLSMPRSGVAACQVCIFKKILIAVLIVVTYWVPAVCQQLLY